MKHRHGGEVALADHVEILYDVDILFRAYAANLGIRLERPPSLNASHTLARAVAELARLGLTRLKVEGACRHFRISYFNPGSLAELIISTSFRSI